MAQNSGRNASHLRAGLGRLFRLEVTGGIALPMAYVPIAIVTRDGPQPMKLAIELIAFL